MHVSHCAYPLFTSSRNYCILALYMQVKLCHVNIFSLYCLAYNPVTVHNFVFFNHTHLTHSTVSPLIAWSQTNSRKDSGYRMRGMTRSTLNQFISTTCIINGAWAMIGANTTHQGLLFMRLIKQKDFSPILVFFLNKADLTWTTVAVHPFIKTGFYQSFVTTAWLYNIVELYTNL